ncbi:L,D-transpeptidase [Loktanella sp. DJP18]|uniref:L,D-transpeptidase n=1 Tax=Loktanella sp. DJP18 TaxID=3409788 RepID=UPI003BB57F6E
MTLSSVLSRRSFGAMLIASSAAACAPRVPESAPIEPQVNWLPEYAPLQDAGYDLPAIPLQYTQGINRRMEGLYTGEAPAGSIDVDPYAKFLYHVRYDGTATRYPIGVGRQGRTLSGLATIQDKKAWPGWTPTANMLRTEPEVYGGFRSGVPGGLRSPLGARALYIYRNGRDTYYRVHGTNDLESIGNSGSAGCIRLFNQDIIHLYNNVSLPMTINIRSEAESLRVDPENFNRGVELPPKIISPEELLGQEAISNDREPDLSQLAQI